MRTVAHAITDPLVNGVSPFISSDFSKYLMSAQDIIFDDTVRPFFPHEEQDTVPDFRYQLISTAGFLFKTDPKMATIIYRDLNTGSVGSLGVIQSEEFNGLWTAVQVGDIVLLTNGSLLIKFSNIYPYIKEHKKVSGMTITSLNDSFIFTADITNGAFLKYMADYKGSIDITETFTRSYFFWTTPGTTDLIDLIFFDANPDYTYLEESVVLNLFGWSPSNTGVVTRLYGKNGALYIFGERSMSIFATDNGNNDSIDLPLTYGFVDTYNRTLVDPQAIASSPDTTLFIDNTYNMVMLDKGVPQLIGFGHVFDNKSSQYRMMYDETNNAFVITTEDVSYILGKRSIANLSHTIYGTFGNYAITLEKKHTTQPRYTTLPIRPNAFGGINTLTGGVVHTDDTDTCIEVTFLVGDNELTIPAVINPVSKSFNLRIKAVSFVVHIICKSPLSFVTLNFQNDDKRNTRTAHAVDYGV